jgi:hypothetical protein
MVIISKTSAVLLRGPKIEIQFCAQNIWPKSAPYLQAHPQSHDYPLHAFNLIETAALSFELNPF